MNELLQQTKVKAAELAKYRDLQSALKASHAHGTKQVSTMDALRQHFVDAMTEAAQNRQAGPSSAAAATLHAEVESIKKNLVTSLNTQRTTLAGKVTEVDGLQGLHTEAVAEQRRYLAAVKAFQDACQLNETLAAE